MRPFPFDANWSDPFIEGIAYPCDVMQADDGTEQRLSLREVPTGTIEYTAFAASPAEAAWIDALVWAHQHEQWAVPLWPYAQHLGADLTVPHTTVPCMTDDIPFAASPRITSPSVLLWLGPAQYELAAVATVAVGSLVLAAPTASAWPAGTLLVPTRAGRLAPSQRLPRPASAVRTPRFTWTLEDLPS